jgi:hypothetical protein
VKPEGGAIVVVLMTAVMIEEVVNCVVNAVAVSVV